MCIADLNSSVCFLVAFSTSKRISSLISDKRSALTLSNVSLITKITSNTFVSLGVALPDLASGILKLNYQQFYMTKSCSSD